MKVRVRLFAAVRQAAGRESVELELCGGATVGELRRRLVEQLPQISGVIARAMFAIDTAYVRDADEIPPGADVACIPPVSGG